METINYKNEVAMISENMKAANDLMIAGCEKTASALSQLKENDKKMDDILNRFKV